MIVEVKVIPQSRENAVIEFKNTILKIRVQGTPVKGKVNETLVKFLADSLGISRSQVAILSGLTTPKKRIEIKGVDQEFFNNWLASVL